MKSIDSHRVIEDLVQFLRSSFRAAGFSRAVIAMSGGVDSSTSCALAHDVTFLLFPRNGHPLPERLPKGFQTVSSPELVTSNVSSTIVRSRLTKGLSVSGMIPEGVLEYIRHHSLYRIIA